MPTELELTGCERKGSEASLYLNYGDDPAVVGGSDCSVAVWAFHKGVIGDLNLGETEDKEEQTNRSPGKNVKQYGESMIDLEISGEQTISLDYGGNAFINSMRTGGYARDIMILNGYITEIGSYGWRGKFRNYDRSWTGPESGPGRQTFSLAPASCVKDGCLVRPVKVTAADTIATYNPETFTYS